MKKLHMNWKKIVEIKKKLNRDNLIYKTGNKKKGWNMVLWSLKQYKNFWKRNLQR